MFADNDLVPDSCRMRDADFDALNAAVSALGREFLAVPATVIARMVSEEYRRYAGRPVREFVPMLVEQAVRKRLLSDADLAS